MKLGDHIAFQQHNLLLVILSKREVFGKKGNERNPWKDCEEYPAEIAEVRKFCEVFDSAINLKFRHKDTSTIKT